MEVQVEEQLTNEPVEISPLSPLKTDLNQSDTISPLKTDFNQSDTIAVVEGDMEEQMKPKPEDNRKSEENYFINGPAKLKKKWVDVMGGPEKVAQLNLTKNEIKRQEVIYEMIDTERDYVTDLSIIIELYLNPLKNNNIINKKDLNTLFSNVEQLFGVNKELLTLFEVRQHENPYINEIGDIWLTMNEYLKMYLLYCSNYAYALTKLENLKNTNRYFTKFLNTQLQRPESRCLRLDSFLIKPVQRICKYPLLLKELMKYTDESHKDYENLKNGYAKLQTVVTVVNGASKVVEVVYNLIDFQSRFNPKISIVSPTRKIKYKGEVTIYMKKMSSPTKIASTQDLLANNNIEKKKRLLYVFNDMIIFAKALTDEPNKLEKAKLKLIEMRKLSEVEVNTITDTNDESSAEKNNIEIVLSNPDVMGIIFCENENEKSELLNQLNNILKDYQASNTEKSQPKVVKRLPSEKVYSMISNMSQDISDNENENEGKEDDMEGEKIEIRSTEIVEEESSPSTGIMSIKVNINLACSVLAIVGLSLLILFFKSLDVIEAYPGYTIPTLLVGSAGAQFAIKKRKEKTKEE